MIKPRHRALMCYIWQYRIHHARHIRHAPPSLQLHAKTLQRNGLGHRWLVGKTGYYLDTKKDTAP